ncbi:hypothetical protein C5167_006681 [Papaver somniferum]|uniref:Uncharacterized protein n=1 Tax=Papaver somniferum TaxID=3469 RepID=A0A4Y7JH48_PAPSO|nr:hypothetical protein C5167_006681 [Papaver somniferum]
MTFYVDLMYKSSLNFVINHLSIFDARAREAGEINKSLLTLGFK